MTPEQETILRLVAQLRQIDQLIYKMSQCTDWLSMRPIFMELQAGMMQRMKEESDRIKMLMLPEIVRTYAKPQETHTPADGHPRLEGPRDACPKDSGPDRYLDKPDCD